MSAAPPCPTCGNEVQAFEAEQRDQSWGMTEDDRVLTPPHMWVKPCGHTIRGYVANEAGFIEEWKL